KHRQHPAPVDPYQRLRSVEKTISGHALPCGNACPWTAYMRHTEWSVHAASYQAFQVQVCDLSQSGQIDLGVDSSRIGAPIPQVIADLFQRKSFDHKMTCTRVSQCVRAM